MAAGALAASLAQAAANLGSYEEFARAFPVTIIPPLPAHPLLKIVGIEKLQFTVYGVLGAGNREVAHIRATGISIRPLPSEPVLRTTPRLDDQIAEVRAMLSETPTDQPSLLPTQRKRRRSCPSASRH